MRGRDDLNRQITELEKDNNLLKEAFKRIKKDNNILKKDNHFYRQENVKLVVQLEKDKHNVT